MDQGIDEKTTNASMRRFHFQEILNDNAYKSQTVESIGQTARAPVKIWGSKLLNLHWPRKSKSTNIEEQWT